MFKKIVTTLITLNIIIVTSFNVVACQNSRINSDVWLIAQGQIDDHSFAENSYDGANDFLNSMHLQKNKAAHYHISPSTYNSYVTAYKTANYYNAKVAVLPGFDEGPTLKEASQILKYAIFIDGSLPTKRPLKYNQLYANMIGISFKAEKSGFYAGIASCAYLNNVLNGDHDRRVSEFGGQDNEFAIDNYLYGYLAGVELWNYVTNFHNSNTSTTKSVQTSINNFYSQFLKIANAYPSKNNKIIKKIGFVGLSNYQGQFNKTITKLSKTSKYGLLDWQQTSNKFLTNLKNWFTLGFTQTSDSKLMAKTLSIDSQIIFPVAGSQTIDAVNAMKTDPTHINKVIGVDVDQSNVFGKDIILTSAEKKLDVAVKAAIQNTYDYGWGIKTDKQTSYNKQGCWLGRNYSEPPKTAGSTPKPWVGIASNPIGINDKMVKLITSSTIAEYSNLISQKFQGIIQEYIKNKKEIKWSDFLFRLSDQKPNYIYQLIESL